MKRHFLFFLLVAFALTMQAQRRITGALATPVTPGQQPAALSSQQHAAPARVEGLSSIQRAVGFIAGNDPDSITIKGLMVGEAGSYPVAVAIGPDILAPYVGCQVVGIRIAAAQSLGKSNTFLRTISEQGIISSSGIDKSQRLYEGWNNVFFNGDTSLEIEEDQTLLVGFEYNETEDMAASDQGGLCTVGESKSGGFLIYTDYGSGLGWYSINQLGALCIQLIVDVSNLPARALSLSYVDTGFRYKKAGDKVETYIIAANNGREDVSSYSLVCQLDDEAPVTFRYDEVLHQQGNAHQQPTLTLPADIAVGAHQLQVTLLAEDDTEPLSEDAVMTSRFYVYDKYLQRQKNYVEQYNSQDAYMASIVDPIFEEVAGQNPSMALVNVYAPGTGLSLPDADYLHELYAYTLPSFTINRSYFPGEAYIAYDVNDYVLAIPDLIPSMIGDMLLQEDLNPAFASVTLSPSWQSAGRELTVNVSGEVADDAAALFGDLALTVMLTEDKVVARQMTYNAATGRSSWNQNYQHDHVLRTYLTAPLGDKLTVSDGHYTAQYQLSLPDDWKAEDLSVIAFVTRAAETVTDDNVMSMDITNANSVSLADIVTGIEDATLARPWSLARARIDNGQWTTDNIVVYDLQGRKISTIHYPFSTSEAPFASLPRGVYVVKQGKKVKKIMKQ